MWKTETSELDFHILTGLPKTKYENSMDNSWLWQVSHQQIRQLLIFFSNKWGTKSDQHSKITWRLGVKIGTHFSLQSGYLGFCSTCQINVCATYHRWVIQTTSRKNSQTHVFSVLFPYYAKQKGLASFVVISDSTIYLLNGVILVQAVAGRVFPQLPEIWTSVRVAIFHVICRFLSMSVGRL